MSKFDDDLDDLFGDMSDKKKVEEKAKPEPEEEKEETKGEEKKEEKTPKTETEDKEEKVEEKSEEATGQTDIKPKEEVVKEEVKVKPLKDDLFGDDDDDDDDDLFADEKPRVEKPKAVKNDEIPVLETVENAEFDLTPEEGMGKPVVVIYGKKGHGKTHLSYTLPGKNFSVLCFDEKSQIISSKPDFQDKDIEVYDCIKHLRKTTPDEWLETSYKSWRFINAVLDKIETENKTDWMVVDGGEITHQMFEMVMRYKNDLKAFQGIANKNIWKYRRMLIDQLLTRCVQVAKMGVIWTSYIKEDAIIQDGDYVSKEEVPKWIDAVLYRTDTVIRVHRKTTKNGQRFYATVETSKWDKIPDGPKVDVTDKGCLELMAGE